MNKNTIKLIIIALGVILINSCGAKKETINPEQVMGYWKAINGDSDYAQFEKIDSEYVYSAFTYDRLASTGTWDVNENGITINFDDGSSTQLKVDFNGDTMIFNDGEERFVRVILSGDGQTPVGDIGDVQILEMVIQNIDLVFSDLEPFTEEWITSGISWQKITAELVLKNEGFSEVIEAANQISKYLVTQGFEIDTNRTSEMVSSYKRGNVYVIVRTRASNEPSAGETTFVDVISGVENK
ncbi:MAG: hypothetical protein AB9846_05265 [Tenuifilaceae bacterium]